MNKTGKPAIVVDRLELKDTDETMARQWLVTVSVYSVVKQHRVRDNFPNGTVNKVAYTNTFGRRVSLNRI